jgi:LysM repeat protein
MLCTLFLAGSVAFIPLACTSSSADSSDPETTSTTEARTESDEDEATYEVPAYTDERSVQQRLNDATVTTQIQRALIRQRALQMFDFDPVVSGRTVTLQGDVNTKAQWRLVGETARQVARDREVVNAVTIGGQPADEVVEDNGEENTGASTAVYHTVERGESLWTIAREYGASVQRLRSLNDLGARGLQTGERIRVR